MKYIRYRRKSSEREERQALSTESQRRELEQRFPEIKIAADFEENKSAFYPDNRPKFQKMIFLLESGKAEGIVAWHPDRLSRNEIDAAKITYLIRTGVIKDIKFGSYHFDNSPEGIMMLQIALSQSQYYSSKLGKDVKRGLKTKAENGVYPAMAPQGYLDDTQSPKGERRKRKDPERFDVIRKSLKLVVKGEAPLKVLDRLNKEWNFKTRKIGKLGGKPLSNSGWYRILGDPFYYGEFEYPKDSGNWYDGNHEPMITKEEYDIIQQRLGAKGKNRYRKHDFAFTGLMKCGECGSSITAEEKWQCICTECKYKFSSAHTTVCPKCETDISEMDNPTILHYIYYRCTKKKNPKCTQGYLRKKDLEEQIDEFLRKVQISKRFKDWAVKYLKKAHKKEAKERKSVKRNVQTEHDTIEEKLDKLLDMKLNEEITDEEYQKKKKQLKREKKDLEGRFIDTSQRQDKWIESAERFFDFACNARYWFENGTKEDKRVILETLGSNLIIKDKRLEIKAPKPFIIIKNTKKDVPEISPGFEPKERGLTGGQMEALYASSPSLLPVVDTIRTLPEKYQRAYLYAPI